MTSIVERLRGRGNIVDASGAKHAVDYLLEVLQDKISSGTGDPPLPGLKSVRGQISPMLARLFGLDSLTLELQDGRHLRIMFTSDDGSIAGMGAIE